MGYHRVRIGLEQAIARAISYAPYADMVWCREQVNRISLEAMKLCISPESVKDKFPDKLLAYNCSPSFNWKKKLDGATIAKFQRELGAMGYKFQFVTLAGFTRQTQHVYARAWLKTRGMAAYSGLQESREFAAETDSYTATKHQRKSG